MTTLINNFHGTEAKVQAVIYNTISERTERRVWKALCGMDDCKCSGAGGVRGGAYALSELYPSARYQIVHNIEC